MIEFSGEFDSDHAPEQLWKYFTDPDILAQCAPGCDHIEQESESELSATVAVGVGSVKPTFDVDMVVVEAQQPNRLVMNAGGDASRNSFETVAEMDLVANGSGGTTATWHAETNVSGLIASLGQRALGSVAERLVNNFFDDLEELADEGVPAESKISAKPEAEATLEE
ncbi:CoxG family protein [Halobacterium bonnevillei]|jgi:carbon monoxide dehydrogenase subunit G|uniref:Carbon monoxide dehydrogenase n=1 Tax=Halobacterium bonnevillei TaxID=2692200 RepID=A0A6B0SJ93_9EURY|nr:carbon monoxide dehydrogenase subunit G [Halobacterium bonnevillei]MXR21884.1 carbon monoxide dehydrogenase [Halobacterium bonnevillei]